MQSELNIKFIQYLLNLKALNYLKENNLIEHKVYEKARVRLEKIVQS